jgi:hypothetical protein
MFFGASEFALEMEQWKGGMMEYWFSKGYKPF